MRKLKFHEKKLLKKVDFLKWKTDQSLREIKVSFFSFPAWCVFSNSGGIQASFGCQNEALAQVIKRYHITDRDDYKKYNKLCGLATKLVDVLKRLQPTDPARIELTDQLLDKCGSWDFWRPKTTFKRALFLWKIFGAGFLHVLWLGMQILACSHSCTEEGNEVFGNSSDRHA
jgi:Ribosomal protein S4/S9 N-terminal domain